MMSTTSVYNMSLTSYLYAAAIVLVGSSFRKLGVQHRASALVQRYEEGFVIFTVIV